jgi:hypothetical protein
MTIYGVSKYTNLEKIIYVFNKYLQRNFHEQNIVSG